MQRRRCGAAFGSKAGGIGELLLSCIRARPAIFRVFIRGDGYRKKRMLGIAFCCSGGSNAGEA